MGIHERAGRTGQWFTPKYIFAALGCKFDLDVAASKSLYARVPAACWFNEKSLTRHWFGFVWMNPPYGGRNGLKDWVTKFVEHGNGIALVPDRTSAPWFQYLATHCESILFISPKIKFVKPNGKLGKSPANGSALVAIGVKGRDALQRANKLGILVYRVKTS